MMRARTSIGILAKVFGAVGIACMLGYAALLLVDLPGSGALKAETYLFLGWVICMVAMTCLGLMVSAITEIESRLNPRDELIPVSGMLRKWDPLGVYSVPLEKGDQPWPEDEYPTHIPHILWLLRAGHRASEPSEYLESARAAMSAPPDPVRDAQTAKEIQSWWHDTHPSHPRRGAP